MNRLLKNGMMGKRLISSSRKYISGHFVPHFHDFYEIEYIIRGSGICTINGENAPCSDGMLFLMTPMDYHSVQTDGAEVFNIMFSEQLVEFQQLEPFLRYSSPKAVAIDSQIRPFIEQILTEVIETEDIVAYSSALMRCLLMKLAQLFPQTGSSNGSDVVSKIHFYIINNYRARVTLDTAAAHVGLTPSYVSALFKSEMQIGFKAYLNSLRLEYARKLLISTEQSIKQICEESGFEDIPNFIKRFKAYHGMTPTMLRKNGPILSKQKHGSDDKTL